MAVNTIASRARRNPATKGSASKSNRKPFLSIIVAAYNEEQILEENARILTTYLAGLEDEYRWELIVVNDGSSDRTAEIADFLETMSPNIRTFHHPANMGLCEALKTGFEQCEGDYAVTLDIDLSYSPDHIERLLARIRETHSQVVIASPYMEGGRVENVPRLRHFLSRWSNKFLSRVSPERIHTFTGMVRAYDVPFLKSLNLKSKGMDVNPEIVYKAILLRARVEEIPATLKWLPQEETADTPANEEATVRKSSLCLPWQTLAILFSGFVFRPFLFFLIPGFAMLLLATGMGIFLLGHCFIHALELETTGLWNLIGETVHITYAGHGTVFFMTGGLVVLSMQFLTLGFLSMQSKRYFEEIFHLGTTIYRTQNAAGAGK